MRARAAAALLSLALGEASCAHTSSPAAADASAAPAAEPTRAEFAVRWNPALGGPGSPDEVLDILGTPRVSASVFEIQYFALPPPPDAPPDATVILRRRRNEKGKAELRLKYRLRAPLGRSWACPAGIDFDRKEEVDFSFTAAGAPIRVYSYSCTLSGGEPPAALAAVPKECASRMARYESGRFKVEQWTFSGGLAQLEVSLSARNTAEELAGFERVVARLLDRGVKPSDRSKTEAGSDCPAGEGSR